MQSLSDVVPYTYYPNGKAGSGLFGGGSTGSGTSGGGGSGTGGTNPNNFNYTISGGALTNPSPTEIDMATAQVFFPTNAVQYNARVFTITAPSVPTTYYVTIADPGYLGDTGTQTNLVATCQASNALVGVSGNTYIGSIVALPTGGGTVTTVGGLPTGGSGNGSEQIFVNGA